MLLSVITPTYNRAKLLPRLYKSLCNQSYRNFEWIVVDDGSTDETSVFMERTLAVHHDFPIRYYKKVNGGKHTAVNMGVNQANGQLIFIADSDDMLLPQSLQIVADEFASITDDDSFCGVCGLDCDMKGNVVGSGLPQDRIDANSLDLRMKFGVQGDLKEVFETKVMKEFPFPEIEGERFCPEALVWNRIAQKYKLRCFNAPIYQVEYQKEGLTSNIVRIRMQSPVASMMTYQEMTEYQVPYAIKVKSAINYWRFWWCANAEKRKLVKISSKWLPMKFLGWLMHLKDIKKL